MSSFTLPSGRVLDLKDRPTFGDICAARRVFRESESDPDAFNQCLMSTMTGLEVHEITGLDWEDGDALQAEVDRRAAPRSSSDERPFGKRSRRTSAAE